MDEKVSLFTSTHDVVMLDVGTHLNLCSSVSTNAYRELRKEASATSEWLNRDTGGSLDTFDPIFLQNISFFHRHDLYLTVAPPSFTTSTRASQLTLTQWNTTGTLQHISDLLQRGMNNRITSIRVIFDSRQKNVKKQNILIGITLHPMNAARTLDRGPSADNVSEAESYRNFWGDKSELRRFKDGTILEACFWGSTSKEITVPNYHVR